MRHLLRPLVPLVLLAACAPASSSAPPPAQPNLPSRVLQAGGSTDIRLNNEAAPEAMRVAAEAARVWELLPAVYAELQIPLGTLEPAQRRIGNTRISLRRRLADAPLSRYLDCGSGLTAAPYADTYLVTASILTTLQPAEGSATDVFTTVSASARNPGTSSDPLACSSRGTLEQRIVELLRQRLQQ